VDSGLVSKLLDRVENRVENVLCLKLKYLVIKLALTVQVHEKREL
jgi:hypothetical protein